MLPGRRHPAKGIIEDDRTPTLIFLTGVAGATARQRVGVSYQLSQHTRNSATNPGPFRSLASPKNDPDASPYPFFNNFRKNGAVRLTLLFATSSGDPVATISPPNSPASGPTSIKKSASPITSKLCSITTTVLPSSTNR